MRLLGRLFAAALLASFVMSAAEGSNMETITFPSGGKSIGMKVFGTGAANSPAILVLHGAGGVDAGNRYVGQLAAAVAANGYATFIVEYFDRTDTTYASDRVIQKSFDSWLETIADATTVIAERADIDRDRIGTFGYSLGGYLAVAHAARDSRVRATVELAGGIDSSYSRQVRRLPPLLIVHGEQDQRVPFDRGVELEKVARRLGSPVETLFFPNERHILSPAAAFQALARALTFFETHLR
jgi:dipeptidyl aminopeptidase/acylaminoacyl peptidase